jgi:hypothetical protein
MPRSRSTTPERPRAHMARIRTPRHTSEAIVACRPDSRRPTRGENSISYIPPLTTRYDCTVTRYVGLGAGTRATKNARPSGGISPNTQPR